MPRACYIFLILFSNFVYCPLMFEFLYTLFTAISAPVSWSCSQIYASFCYIGTFFSRPVTISFFNEHGRPCPPNTQAIVPYLPSIEARVELIRQAEKLALEEEFLSFYASVHTLKAGFLPRIEIYKSYYGFSPILSGRLYAKYFIRGQRGAWVYIVPADVERIHSRADLKDFRKIDYSSIPLLVQANFSGNLRRDSLLLQPGECIVSTVSRAKGSRILRPNPPGLDNLHITNALDIHPWDITPPTFYPIVANLYFPRLYSANWANINIWSRNTNTCDVYEFDVQPLEPEPLRLPKPHKRYLTKAEETIVKISIDQGNHL